MASSWCPGVRGSSFWTLAPCQRWTASCVASWRTWTTSARRPTNSTTSSARMPSSCRTSTNSCRKEWVFFYLCGFHFRILSVLSFVFYLSSFVFYLCPFLFLYITSVPFFVHSILATTSVFSREEYCDTSPADFDSFGHSVNYLQEQHHQAFLFSRFYFGPWIASFTVEKGIVLPIHIHHSKYSAKIRK